MASVIETETDDLRGTWDDGKQRTLVQLQVWCSDAAKIRRLPQPSDGQQFLQRPCAPDPARQVDDAVIVNTPEAAVWSLFKRREPHAWTSRSKVIRSAQSAA